MATVYWEGHAEAVAQVDTGSIDSVDATPANNTFTVTINGQAVSVAGDTDVATTAGNLVAALNASLNPYFKGITWANPSSGTITATADNAGEPFTAALTETGAGTGTVTDFSNTTASAGPNDWSTADNWSGGAVPVNADDVIIRDSNINILWGLDQSAVDLTSLTIEASYTGLIGLPRNRFTTNASGSSFSSTKVEYRQTYLDIGWTTARIGLVTALGGAGSERLKLDNDKSGSSTTTIYSTASTSKDAGLPAVRLLAAHANADVYVRSSPAGVGIAVDTPGETSTVGVVSISAPTGSNSNVFIGDGVTLTTYQQTGGQAVLDAAATITSVTLDGGSLRTEGTQAITTVNVSAGTLAHNSTGTVTTLNQTGGTVTTAESNEARTITTYNLDGGTLVSDDAYLTITTLDHPAGNTTVNVLVN